MARTTDVNSPLIERLQSALNVKSDKAVAIALGLGAPEISRIRRGTRKVSASFALRAQEIAGLSLSEIRELLGLPQDYLFSR